MTGDPAAAEAIRARAVDEVRAAYRLRGALLAAHRASPATPALEALWWQADATLDALVWVASGRCRYRSG
ncbi:MAG: hypothetical protein RLZ55_1795 [Actinomycetota bacterium]